MSETKAIENWFARRVEAEAKKDVLSFSERVGDTVAALVILLCLLFWFAHQTSSSGFFTSKFGPAEVFWFYFPTVFGLVTNVAKVVVGRKNMLRPFETLETGLGAVGVVWLLVVFPFEFSHLADVLPDFLRFLLLWISNDVAKVLLVILIIGFSAGTVYTALMYVFVRRKLFKPTLKTA